MGTNSHYFRHSLTAHRDLKIQKLIDEEGLGLLGFYWILLEVYGAAYTDDDSRSVLQVIHLRNLTASSGLRCDYGRAKLKKLHQLGLINDLRQSYDRASVELAIPNFLKYFGSYKKTADIKIENGSTVKKEKQNKEKKEKKKEKEEFICDPFFDDAFDLGALPPDQFIATCRQLFGDAEVDAGLAKEAGRNEQL